MTSDWAINLHHERMESDPQYAADYDRDRQMDKALYFEWCERERENEKFTDWFPDKRIDYTGYEEIDGLEPNSHFLIDDAIPF